MGYNPHNPREMYTLHPVNGLGTYKMCATRGHLQTN